MVDNVETSGDFGPFVGSVSTNMDFPTGGFSTASADQNSEINESSIIASGDASYYAFGPGVPLFGSSTFSVTFTIAVPCSYSLSGNLSSQSQGYGGGCGITFTDSAGNIIQSFAATPYGYSMFSTNGTLVAGEYGISAGAYTMPGVYALAYNLDLELSPVPEPSTSILVGMSLCGLIFGTRCLRRPAVVI